MAIIKNPLTLIKGEESTLITKSITENGTYNAQDDNADGYSEVTVNVSGGGSSDFFWELDENRIIRIPSQYTGLSACKKFSHYVVLYPSIINSNLNSSTGRYVVLYDLNTQQVIKVHEYTRSNSSAEVVQYSTNGNVAIYTYQYDNSSSGAFTWLYDAANDTFTYYDTFKFATYQGRMYYPVYSVYQGSNFGVIQQVGRMYLIDSQMNVTLIQRSYTLSQGSQSYSSYVYTAANGDIYVGMNYKGNDYNYAVYQTAGGVYIHEGVPEIRQYTFSSGTSRYYNKNTQWVGPYCILYPSGGTYSYGVKIIDFTTNPATVKYTNNSGTLTVPNAAKSNDNCCVICCSGSSWYLDPWNENYYFNSTTYTYTDLKILGNRGFIGTNYGMAEITSEGFIYLISVSNVSVSINYCIKSTDLLVAPSTSTGVNWTYIYHTDSDTYDNIKHNTDTSYFSILNTTGTRFTVDSKIPNVYIAEGSSCCCIYCASSDTYYYIRTNSTYTSYARVFDSTYAYWFGYSQNNNNFSIYWITANSVLEIEEGVQHSPTISQYNLKHDNKYYVAYNEGTTPSFKILCYDTVLQTFVISYSDNVNANATNFGYHSSHIIEDSNNIYIPYNSLFSDGSYNSSNTGRSDSVCMVLNKTTGVWSTISNIYCMAECNYDGYLVIRPTSSSTVQILKVADNTITDTGYTPANNYSWKGMDSGIVLIKTTTAIIKYDLSTMEATQLATTTNNSTSNSYGSVRVIDNIGIFFTIGGGYYNSLTETYTASMNSYCYNSSYYTYVRFLKLSNGKLLTYCSGGSSYNGYWTIFDKTEPPTTLISWISELKVIVKGNIYYRFQRGATSSSSTYYNYLDVHAYNETEDTDTQIYYRNVSGPYMSYITIITNTYTGDDWIVINSVYACYNINKNVTVFLGPQYQNYLQNKVFGYINTNAPACIIIYSPVVNKMGVLPLKANNNAPYISSYGGTNGIYVTGCTDVKGNMIAFGTWDLTETELGG